MTEELGDLPGGDVAREVLGGRVGGDERCGVAGGLVRGGRAGRVGAHEASRCWSASVAVPVRSRGGVVRGVGVVRRWAGG